MSPNRRAVVFDLDDTLYPYRRFTASGFAAVAGHLQRTRGVDPRQTLRLLLGASRGPERGRELQFCLASLGLPPGILHVLVEMILGHHPRLSLPRTSSRMLTQLRTEGWRLGVLTNGPHAIQARKVAALGVARYVDSIVYATRHGSGAGKPESEPFKEIARRLNVPADRIVFVGDDETCDVGGATKAGMVAVRCTAWTGGPHPTTVARAVIDRLSDIPQVVRALLEEAGNRHAA